MCTPQAYITNTLTAVIFSYAGFFISPAAVPARTALGLLTAVFSITNKLGLARELPQARHARTRMRSTPCTCTDGVTDAPGAASRPP